MPNYILRDIPADLWERVKTRKNQEGHYLRPLMLQLLEDYAAGTRSPSMKGLQLAANMPPSHEQLVHEELLKQLTGDTVPHGAFKMAFIKLFDGDRTVRIPDVVTAVDDGARLELYGENHRNLGMFSKNDVQSWWLEPRAEATTT